MRIDILSKPEAGRRANQALTNVREALRNLNVEAEVHLYRDRRKMIDNRVYVSPALLIDDDVRIAGRVPTVDEIEKLLVSRTQYHRRLEVA
ncbi:MAG: thioredoxin family protein [Desulfuromonas sp.]|nr:MAG: thioredoxin family protein [Desulfuromonas sp.]